MSYTELLPSVQALSRQEKFRLIQELIAELSREDVPEVDYANWSPHEVPGAAAILMQALEQEKAKAA